MRDKGRRLIKPPLEHKLLNDQQQTEVQSPENEVEVRAVPEAGQEPHDQQVEDLSARALAVAAQGDVYILSEPCAQRDMPASPEFGDALGNIRIVEVLEELKAQHISQSARHVGVAGEVEIDLEGIGDDAHP